MLAFTLASLMLSQNYCVPYLPKAICFGSYFPPYLLPYNNSLTIVALRMCSTELIGSEILSGYENLQFVQFPNHCRHDCVKGTQITQLTEKLKIEHILVCQNNRTTTGQGPTTPIAPSMSSTLTPSTITGVHNATTVNHGTGSGTPWRTSRFTSEATSELSTMKHTATKMGPTSTRITPTKAYFTTSNAIPMSTSSFSTGDRASKLIKVSSYHSLST